VMAIAELKEVVPPQTRHSPAVAAHVGGGPPADPHTGTPGRAR
jgi:hypothetical protein